MTFQQTWENKSKSMGTKRRVYIMPRRRSLPPLFRKSFSPPVIHDDFSKQAIEKSMLKSPAKPVIQSLNANVDCLKNVELRRTADVTLAPEPMTFDVHEPETEGAARCDNLTFIPDCLWKGCGLRGQTRSLNGRTVSKQYQNIQDSEVMFTQQTLNLTLRGNKVNYVEHPLVTIATNKKNETATLRIR